MGKKPTQRYSFDSAAKAAEEFDNEFDTEEPSTEEYEQAAADAVAEAFTGSTDDIDDQLEDVEQRLELASYYRVFLNDNPFNDDSPAATIVGDELKEFVKGRLRVLLGLRAEPTQVKPVELPFNEDEVKALKMIAAKVTGKPALLESKPKPKEPSIRKVEAPKPAMIKKQAPAQPALRKAAGPSTKPQPGKKPVNRSSTPKTTVAPDGTEYIEKNGKKYRKVVEQGVWNTGEVEEKEVLVDVTGQVRNPNALPMPTGKALEIVTMQKAAETIEAAVEGNDPRINAAIPLAIRGD